ncbi:MAG TPA: hypothetical protein VIW45_10650 [Vicinamibacterales bacterium]|jgi:hypothetical protein
MKVRLTKKLADEIDGVSLDGRDVGDVLDISPTEARLLVAEDWATTEERRRLRTRVRFDRRHHESPPLEQETDRERAS